MNVICVYSSDNFVYVNKPLPYLSDISYGISSIATSLKHAGHNPRMQVFTPHSKIAKTLQASIQQHKPRLFCMTAVSSQYPLIRTVARTIKQIDPAIPIILGGHHATLNPGSTIKESCFDAVCVGEGERAVVEAASRIERNEPLSGIKNLWIRNSGEIEKNPQQPFIQDLDSLPIIDRGLWDTWTADKDRQVSILLGRGCPYSCTYCSNHALAKIARGRYVRFRSPENIVAELEEILTRYPSVSEIRLEIDTLDVNLEYTYALCRHLERFNASLPAPVNFSVNFAVTKRVIQDRLNLFQALKQANLNCINIGLESGSERIRNEILKRPSYSNKDIIEFCQDAAQHGLDIFLFVLMGIPGETLQDFKETIACVRQCAPRDVYLAIFYPYPGTELYRKAKEIGVFDEDIVNPVAARRRAALDLPGFSRRQIQREYYLFPYTAFRGQKPLRQILSRMIRGYIYAHPRLNLFHRRLVYHGARIKRQVKFSSSSKK